MASIPARPVGSTASRSAASSGFERFAAGCAAAAAVATVLYAVAFIAVVRSGSNTGATVDALALMAGGLLGTVVFAALYQRVRSVDAGLALWSFVMATVGAMGTAIHGAYDLANIVNPPPGGVGELPSAIDPRGFLAFVVTALALAGFGALLLRDSRMPPRLGYLAIATGAVLVVVYLGRLIALDPNTPWLLAAAGLSGVVLVPALYAWLAVVLSRAPQDAAQPS